MSELKDYGWVATFIVAITGAVGMIWQNKTNKKNSDISLLKQQQETYQGFLKDYQQKVEGLIKENTELKEKIRSLEITKAADDLLIKNSAATEQRLNIELTKEKNR